LIRRRKKARYDKNAALLERRLVETGHFCNEFVLGKIQDKYLESAGDVVKFAEISTRDKGPAKNKIGDPRGG
jgi:hypothetical protein